MNPQTAILIKQVEDAFAKEDATYRSRAALLNQLIGCSVLEKNLQIAVNAHLPEMDQKTYTIIQKIILMAEQASNGEILSGR